MNRGTRDRLWKRADTPSVCLAVAWVGLWLLWPDPDHVRPGRPWAGEMRVSNFLLWQISYAELYVTDTLWPDFRREHLHAAIREYARRERRFGGLIAK